MMLLAAGDNDILFIAGMIAVVLVAIRARIRLKQDRQQFELAKLALEKGQPIPTGLERAGGMMPAWLVSLRTGILVLALGIGLIVIGGAGYRFASAVPEPDKSAWMPPTNESPASMPGIQQPREPFGERPDTPAAPRGLDLRGPNGPEMRGPGGPEMRGPGDGRHGPMFNPVIEKWRRAQDWKWVSLASMGVGVVLVLVGLVRAGFALVEKRFVDGAEKR